jgi:hypothetical protein
MSTAFSDACIHSFPHVWCNPVKSFCSDWNGSPDEIIVDLFGTGKSGNVSQISLWQERTRSQVVFDNEHSLHLWKRHRCTSTVERQLTDWRERVTTWRDLRGLLYGHSDILIWVEWLFYHPVLELLLHVLEFTVSGIGPVGGFSVHYGKFCAAVSWNGAWSLPCSYFTILNLQSWWHWTLHNLSSRHSTTK